MLQQADKVGRLAPDGVFLFANVEKVCKEEEMGNIALNLVCFPDQLEPGGSQENSSWFDWSDVSHGAG